MTATPPPPRPQRRLLAAMAAGLVAPASASAQSGPTACDGALLPPGQAGAELVVETTEPAVILLDDQPVGALAATRPRGHYELALTCVPAGRHRVVAEFDAGGSVHKHVELAAGRFDRVRLEPSDVRLAYRARPGVQFGVGAGVEYSWSWSDSRFSQSYESDEHAGAAYVEGLLDFAIAPALDLRIAPRLALGVLPTETSFDGTMTISTPSGPSRYELHDAYGTRNDEPVLVPSGLLALEIRPTTIWGMYFGIRAGAQIALASDRDARLAGQRVYGQPTEVVGTRRLDRAALPLFEPEISLLVFRLGRQREMALSCWQGFATPVGEAPVSFVTGVGFRRALLP